MKDAGEGGGCVALEGELAVLSGRALGARPLEQHAGHAVPVVGPDSVSLQRYVGGCLEGSTGRVTYDSVGWQTKIHSKT